MKNIINRIFNISLPKDKDSNIDIEKQPSYKSGEISIKFNGEDEEKLIYTQKVALNLENLNEISKENQNIVAVSASKVFNFKDME